MYPARSVIGMATTTETKTRYLIAVTYYGREVFVPFATDAEHGHLRLARQHLAERCGVDLDHVEHLRLVNPFLHAEQETEQASRRRRFVERLVRWVHA